MPHKGEEEAMSEQTRVSHPKKRLVSTDVEGFDSLTELALDMRWSWNHATDQAWPRLDPVLCIDRDQLMELVSDDALGDDGRAP
jgi:hypothetical protein